MDKECVRCFKLSNGETIIGEIQKVMVASYVVSSPMIILEGLEGTCYYEWIPSSSDIA